MDLQPEDVPNHKLDSFIEDVRQRLLALKKARVAGAKLASIVEQSLPAGSTFRDFLPDTVDRNTASFRVFAERSLSDVVSPTSERRGTDLLYDIIDSGQEIEPEPGDLWRTFVSVKPKSQLILDKKTLLLSAVALHVSASGDHSVISPVSLSEHKDVCEAYLQELKKNDIQVQPLDEVLQDYTAASYTKWLKNLRAHTPPLDRQWGEFRKQAIFKIFEKRLRELDFAVEQFPVIVNQLASDGHRKASATATLLITTTPEAKQLKETVEDQVRRRLHSVIDRMTLDQMNALLIPFSLFPKDAQ